MTQAGKQAGIEAAARAIAHSDDEDYMESYSDYDRRAQAAITAYLAAEPQQTVEPVAYRWRRAADTEWAYRQHDPKWPSYSNVITEPLFATPTSQADLINRLVGALELGLDLISIEKGFGTYPRMESSSFYMDASGFNEIARATISQATEAGFGKAVDNA